MLVKKFVIAVCVAFFAISTTVASAANYDEKETSLYVDNSTTHAVRIGHIYSVSGSDGDANKGGVPYKKVEYLYAKAGELRSFADYSMGRVNDTYAFFDEMLVMVDGTNTFFLCTVYNTSKGVNFDNSACKNTRKGQFSISLKVLEFTQHRQVIVTLKDRKAPIPE